MLQISLERVTINKIVTSSSPGGCSFYFLPPNTLTHGMAVLLGKVDIIRCKELVRWIGRRTSPCGIDPPAQAGIRQEVVNERKFFPNSMLKRDFSLLHLNASGTNRDYLSAELNINSSNLAR